MEIHRWPSGRLPGRRLARDLPRARRVHHAAAVPGRAEHPGSARPPSADLARHARPAGPGRPRRASRSAPSASRSSTTPAATACPSGPGGDIEWTPILIGDEDGWVDRYRGLWGLDTGDRFAGERAPAGPKYTRTGSVRQSWHDPLGFAGLGKVAPPSQAIPRPRGTDRGADDGAGRGHRRRRMPWRSRSRSSTRRSRPSAARRASTATGRREHSSSGPARRGSRRLRVQEVELGTAIAAGSRTAGRPRAGHLDDPRLHLRHASEPEPPSVARRRAFGEAWAALSVGLLIVVARGRRLVPDPAATPGDRRPLRVVPRDRVVLRPQRHGAGAQDHVVLAMLSALILAVTYLRELFLAGLLALGVILVSRQPRRSPSPPPALTIVRRRRRPAVVLCDVTRSRAGSPTSEKASRKRLTGAVSRIKTVRG